MSRPLAFGIAYMIIQGWCNLLRGQIQPAPIPAPAPPPSSVTGLPQYFITTGGGTVQPGRGGFAYQCFGVLLGQATFAVSCQQFTVVQGQVETCALAGLTKVTHQFGFVSFGVTGLGGGCESTDGNANAAGNTQAFVAFRVGHTGFQIPITLEKTFSAVGKQEAKITAGLLYAWGK